MINYIRDQLPDAELLAQLAEEATELAQAALKMRRSLDGKNPTPVSAPDAWANLQEEVADVLLCLTVLGVDFNEPEYGSRMGSKLDRWAGRLQQYKGSIWEDKTESGLLEE